MLLKNKQKFTIIIEELGFKKISPQEIFDAKDLTLVNILKLKYPSCFIEVIEEKPIVEKMQEKSENKMLFKSNNKSLL